MIKLKHIILIIALISLPNICLALYRENPAPINQAELPTRIILKLRPDSLQKSGINRPVTPSVRLTELFRLNSQYNIKQMFPLLQTTGDFSNRISLENIYIAEIAPNQDQNEILAAYGSLPGIIYAEIDQIAEYYDSPNDALYPHQWNVNNIGQDYYQVKRIYGNYNDELILASGIADADIDADEVYQNPPDNTTTVVVAIIDTGVDMEHPDLADNIWNNPGEIPDDGIDNDFNGFIDDIHGWDFGGSLAEIGIGDNNPSDEDGHGTHLAGIVAAVTNNNIGIAGIADNCKIMALKIDPLPFISLIARAIIYAADNGADVINMSFGLYTRSDLVEDALSYAHSRGVILCAAAGNDGAEQYNYPAASDLVVAVGASDDKDNVTSFSTYGSHIDLCAPGLSILSLRASNTDMYASSKEPGVHIIDDFYFLASGTSMASPHVAAAAAYLRAVSPGIRPERVLEILEQTADDFIDPYGAGWNLPGFDIYSGFGRLNLHSALSEVPEIRAAIISPMQYNIVSGRLEINGIADGGDFYGYVVEYGLGMEPLEWNNLIFSTIPVTEGTLVFWNTEGLSGPYTIRLRAGFDNIAYRTVYIVNERAAEIICPHSGDNLTGITSIRANAFSPEFISYRLEYREEQSENWITINYSSVPAFNNIIGEWAVGELAEGNYILRLVVTQSDASEIIDEIPVRLQSLFSTENAWKVQLEGQPSIIPNYGDFDGDGLSEIIVGTSSGIYVFNTDGTVKSDAIPEFPENNFMIPIAVGELDGDGIDDIVALGYDPPMVYSFLSSGLNFVNYLANFPDLSYTGSEHSFTKLFLKDMNNDGRDEIIAHLYERTRPLSFIIASDGSSQKMFEYTSEFLPADLNNDGIDEIYAFYQNFSALRRVDIDGNILNEIILGMDGNNFICHGISAGDIDRDGKLELIVFGYYNSGEYFLHAFNENLIMVTGWPHNLGIDPFVLPTAPIFGDLDNDGIPEYTTTFYDLDISYIMAWKLDGSSFLPGSPNGHFAVTPQLGVTNMLLLNDMDNDYFPDIVTCANDDPFSTYLVQRIYAWNKESDVLPEFPIIIEPEASTGFRHTPSIGDINGDGYVDMIMTTAENNLIFVNLPGQVYRECSSPVGHWRYNRRMNNIMPSIIPCIPTDLAESDELAPENFSLLQNFPNPFNASTVIDFSLAAKSYTDLSIYNILGQKIRTIHKGELPVGNHSMLWDGKNENGSIAASGIYFYRMSAGEFTDSKKMILLK